MEPGNLAYIALLLAFPASIVAFAMFKTTRAALIVLFGSLLFLPERVHMRIPGMELDKRSIAALCVIVGVLLTARHRVREARLGRPLDWFMIAALLLPLGTILTNSDALTYGQTHIPGLSYRDYVNDALEIAFEIVVPFLIGRVLFRTAEDAKDLLRAYVLSALIYIPFILVELRMSPQFHNWVYGYTPSVFGQAARGDSWRPLVFMNHGLTLAMFFWSAVVGSWMLAKMRAPFWGGSSLPPAVVLTLIFPLLNSLGALIYGIVAVPIVWLTRPRTQVVFSLVLACIVWTYPILRANELFPDQYLVDVSARYAGHGRAESLNFRFENEVALLDKALQRPVFGWGGWGRSRVFDASGFDYSVTDGEWVIRLGTNGWLGYYADFGLMLLPVLLALSRLTRGDSDTRILMGGFAVLTAIRGIDLLPNSGFYLGMIFAGTLTGLAYDAGENRSVNPRVLLAKLLALRQLRALRAATAGRR